MSAFGSISKPGGVGREAMMEWSDDLGGVRVVWKREREVARVGRGRGRKESGEQGGGEEGRGKVIVSSSRPGLGKKKHR